MTISASAPCGTGLPWWRTRTNRSNRRAWSAGTAVLGDTTARNSTRSVVFPSISSFCAGVSIELTKRLYTTASLSFAPLRSNASLTYLDEKTNTALAQSVSRLGLNTLVSAVTIGYRFRLFDGGGSDASDSPAETSRGERAVHVVPLHQE